MLENPRNKEFDVYVLDEVFPEDEHKDFLKLIRELNGDWKKRIDDLDVFWFAWDEEHRGRKYLMRLLDIAKDYFDLSSAIGYETWIRMSTRPRDWHRDHDDRLEMTTGELKYPICTTCYYPYVADDVKDGRLCFENGTIVLPKTNRMVFFGPDVYHNVEKFTGERISILLNPWNEALCQTPCHDPWRRYMV